jgi:hypothetical protein
MAGDARQHAMATNKQHQRAADNSDKQKNLKGG